MTVAYTYNTVSRKEYEEIFPEVIQAGGSPQGLIVHAAGEEKDGAWRIVEVWQSDEERSRWERETLLPALERHGVDTSAGPPEWTRVEVSTLVTG